jgi:antitoxin component of MazEF toxin-antitoxin module
MYTANLRKVGGSIMLAVPRPLLETLDLDIGAEVGLEVASAGHSLAAGSQFLRKSWKRYSAGLPPCSIETARKTS